MSQESARTQVARTRGFRKKKLLLLGYLEAFHLSRNVQELFDSLRGLLLRELRAVEVRFSWLDLRKNKLRYAPSPSSNPAQEPEEGFSGRAIEQQRTLLLGSDLSPGHSVLVTPLIRDGRLLGTVEVIDRQDGQPFNQEDLDFLDALAPHMAIALNHFLLSEDARLKGEVEQRLREIARSINASLDLTQILEDILEHLRGLMPYDAAAIFLFGNTQPVEELALFGYTPSEREALVSRTVKIRQLWTEQGSSSCLLSSRDYGDRYPCVRPDTEAEVLVPLRAGERLVGMFSLANHQREAYSQRDLELLETFAYQATSAIERARLHKSLLEKTQLEQEVRIAREIQLKFLPSEMPRISGLELAARNVASQMVSGDYYDFIPIVAGQWGVVIGDVAGKGISAGLIMSAFRASLLAEIRNNFALSTILSKVNKLLWETTDTNRFVTAFYGVLDEQQRVLTYSNAGHNPPLLFRSGGRVERLEEGGTVLGAFPDPSYVEHRVRLQPGDLLLLYTDGLTESHNAEGEELGVAGLEALLQKLCHEPAQVIADSLVEEATRHSAQRIPEDDATLVVVKVSEPR